MVSGCGIWQALVSKCHMSSGIVRGGMVSSCGIWQALNYDSRATIDDGSCRLGHEQEEPLAQSRQEASAALEPEETASIVIGAAAFAVGLALLVGLGMAWRRHRRPVVKGLAAMEHGAAWETERGEGQNAVPSEAVDTRLPVRDLPDQLVGPGTGKHLRADDSVSILGLGVGQDRAVFSDQL